MGLGHARADRSRKLTRPGCRGLFLASEASRGRRGRQDNADPHNQDGGGCPQMGAVGGPGNAESFESFIKIGGQRSRLQARMTRVLEARAWGSGEGRWCQVPTAVQVSQPRVTFDVMLPRTAPSCPRASTRASSVRASAHDDNPFPDVSIESLCLVACMPWSSFWM